MKNEKKGNFFGKAFVFTFLLSRKLEWKFASKCTLCEMHGLRCKRKSILFKYLITILF